jgi:hypothetical protein
MPRPEDCRSPNTKSGAYNINNRESKTSILRAVEKDLKTWGFIVN